MKTRLLCLIAVILLLAHCVVAQDATGGKTLTEVQVADLPRLVGSDVIVKGTAGVLKRDPSNTRVYNLRDAFGGEILVRAAQGNPPLHQTYVVHGMVTRGAEGLELTELERRKPATELGIGPPETWTVVAAPDSTPPAGSTSTAGGGETGRDGSKGAPEDETNTEHKSNLPYLLLGGGAILVIAAVAIGLSMKSANDRRLREEQMRAEQDRLAEMQRQDAQRQAEMQRVAAQPAPTVAGVPSAPAPPIGTMVIWGQLTAVSGPLKDRVFPLPHGAIRIGRTEGDVVLEEDQSVSSKHATISQVGDGSVHFEDHSTNGSFVNDRRLNNEKVPLQSGDKIVIGPHTFEIKFSKAALAAPAAGPSSAPGAATVVVPVQQAATVAFSGLQLVVEEGPDQGKTFPVDVPQTTIGRENRDVLLSDEHVSRSHAVILNQEGKWILQNESNHGTVVNGAKQETAELQDGDTIRMGTTVLRFKRLA